jgi:CDP-paratose 2-epimerase
MSQGPVLVTGGAGFIGSNLADRLLSEGREVVVFDALLRPGVEANLAWLQARHGTRIRAQIADIRDAAALREAARDAGAVFHFAAQVAVTTSLDDPTADFTVNGGGTVALLEAVRHAGRDAPVIFASTNKVYGCLGDLAMKAEDDRNVPAEAEIAAHGIDERRPLDFATPYGCSKGVADQYVLDYARSFGMRTAVFRMSCIYGPRQFGTEDQGWLAHFLIRALAGTPITIYGDGRQVRDLLHVSDAVEAYCAALARIDAVKGQVFNLGGGPANAVSLRQVLREIERVIGRPVPLNSGEWRTGDQLYFVADTRKAERLLGWRPRTGWRDGLQDLGRWLRENAELVGIAPAERRLTA